MSGRVTVQTCTKRLDGQYLITFRQPGAARGSALSHVEIREGKSVSILNGKVVRPGHE